MQRISSKSRHETQHLQGRRVWLEHPSTLLITALLIPTLLITALLIPTLLTHREQAPSVNEAGSSVWACHYNQTQPSKRAQTRAQKLLTVDSMNKYKRLCKKLSSVPTTRGVSQKGQPSRVVD